MSNDIHPLIEDVYQALLKIARINGRVPEKDYLVVSVLREHGLSNWPGTAVGCQRMQVFRKMVELGWVRIDIYEYNFRVITLLREDPNGSVHTLQPSTGKPYRTLSPDGKGGVADSRPSGSQMTSRAPVTLPPMPDWLK